MAADDLDAIAAELAALPLAEFTAARDARAKAADDAALATAIRALRKPSPAAWLTNLLVRERPAEVAQLLALGADLREAQQNLDARELAALTKERRSLVTVIAGLAGDLARERGVRVSPAVTGDLARERGVRVSPAVTEELAQTLLAALADAAAADAVASGRLVRSLAVVGFDAVDLDGAVAGTSPTTTAAPVDELAERRRERARRELAEAEGAAAEAAAALRALEKRVAVQSRRRELLVSELATHEQRVRETKRAITEADRDGRLLDAERATLETALAGAEEAARAAQDRLGRA
jgi:hypothetical protein